MKKNGFVLIALVLCAAESVFAMGIPRPGSSVSTPSLGPNTDRAKKADFMDVIAPNETNNAPMDPEQTIDLNRDGTLDYLVCRGGEPSVEVRDGKKRTNVLFSWKHPGSNKMGDGSKRIFTACEVTEIMGGRPSIVVSSSFVHPVEGMRVQGPQFVMLNTGGKLIPKTLQVQSSTGKFTFQSAARNVACARYPKRLVNQGFKQGALCFFAGYDVLSPNDYTMTAALKLEASGNELIAKDLTASSGLPWVGGAKGTAKGYFRQYNAGGDTKRDGLHMMDGAFVDFDQDDLPDLVSVGQHASVRLSKMEIDRSRPEGIRFETSKILEAKYGNMTEFLSVKEFGAYDAKEKLRCLYFTGEKHEGVASRANVPDHVRCFEGGDWVRYELPIDNFSSSLQGPHIAPDSKGRFFVRAPKVEGVGAKSKVTATKFFKVKR